MTSLSTVLVYEFFTGGGCPPGVLPRGLASEALGMLWALLSDFRRWGAVRTITALDPRFENLIPGLNRATLPADEILCAPPGNSEQIFLSLLQRCTEVLVVAPETNGVLSGLIALAEKNGIPHLGSNAAAARIAGNKAACSRIFQQGNLPTPTTQVAGFSSASKAALEIGFPLVIKPVDGVGSEGVFRLESPADLPAALSAVCKVTSHKRILLQTFVQGVHASASLLVSRQDSRALCLNRQLIATGDSLQYFGSQLPFQHRLGDQALELARSAVRLIPGLRGYVGVDMVLSADGAYLIEINPRLTTSYIGLRNVVSINLAHAIWNSCRHNFLPDLVPLHGQAVINKEDPDTWEFQGNNTIQSGSRDRF